VRRFQKIDVNEPTIEDTIKILKGLKPYFEEHHKVRYTNDAIKAAVELSARYINDRKLPDKAIDVIDEVGAMQMLAAPSKRKKIITPEGDRAVIATMARIPPKSCQQATTRPCSPPRERSEARGLRARTRRSRRCPPRSSWRAPACAIRTSRSATICSPAPPASARPKWPQLADFRWASSSSASTCRNIWSATRSRA
jgi:hypothetical protein